MRIGILLFCIVHWAAADNPFGPWSGRIVGGQDATMPGAFPFMASLRTRSNEHFCGGWVHNNRFVITSAHCVNSRNAQDISIHLGTTSRTDQGVAQLPLRIIIHPEFQPNVLGNDIAMIQTINPIAFTGLVNAININMNTITGGTNVIALGWGQTSSTGGLAGVLQSLNLVTITNDECFERHSRFNRPFLHNNTLCTTSAVGQGMCMGDSGGPLITGQQGNHQVVGAVSWGMPCALGAPDVYARVADHMQFINDAILNTPQN